MKTFNKEVLKIKSYFGAFFKLNKCPAFHPPPS